MIMPRHLLRLLGIVGLVAAYGWWIEPSRLRITRYEASDPDKPLAHPIRILLLTDWHLGRFSRPSVMRAKIKRLRRLQRRCPCDLLLLGGDFIDYDARFLKQLTPALQELKRLDLPTFAVLGNHDFTSFNGEVTPVIRCLEAEGIRVLRNQAVPVTVHGQRVLIVGLDDLQESRSYYSYHDYKSPKQYRQAAEALDWYARLDGVEPDTPRVLLSHNPDAVFLPGRRPLVVLAGHTHGGQVMLLDWLSRPFHRWLSALLPPGSAITWAGRQMVGDRLLIVSRGMEGAALPLRLMRSPEAVVVTVR